MTTLTILNHELKEGFSAELISPGNMDEAMELLLGIARWLHSRGSTQWSGLLTGEDSHGLRDAAARGEAVLFRDTQKSPGRVPGRAAGMVILMQQPGPWDRELWGEQGHERYVYLHRLASARDYSGAGLGRSILRWAEKNVVYSGKTAIRLDCIASNPKLGELYRSCGYTEIGISASGFVLFEKELSRDKAQEFFV
ncbi:GNAT family N-acetyltransferase [Paenibacillus pasadenensis]|uniref:GNAT family N-acetyltransferase n=1 Tax=Paenibacillus pasadenensis TaxID=217090 RepID=UPI002040AB1E|nr:GNAT family N-acetyltransferase [Paenibacillus pasadenensis]MCM3748500.1 GNAT family N-acetyltransferase [Paenibacillus pasadenensis]